MMSSLLVVVLHACQIKSPLILILLILDADVFACVIQKQRERERESRERERPKVDECVVLAKTVK